MNKFQVGDRIEHLWYGEGVVIDRPERNIYGIPVKFDSGKTGQYPWGYLAGPEFLTKATPLIQENE